ncbi:MAG TPA: HEAT repeat domain-containing protein, partial [Phycisphaerae bacterium]|nr:HEAT repeat domain-containing protein [Phycisphaerae bacterium]
MEYLGDGRYRVYNLVPGLDYYLAVASPGFRSPEFSESASRGFTLKPGENLDRGKVVLRRFDKTDIPDLLRWLASDNSDTIRESQDAFKTLGPQAALAIDQLATLAKSAPMPHTRIAAIQVLAGLQDGRARAVITAATEDRNLRVRRAATEALKPAPQAAPPATQAKTYRGILAARPAPRLTDLAQRSRPEANGSDATESFWDILKLRDLGDPKAVPVLAEILASNAGTGRIHGYAAAQALFCIGGDEALAALDKHLFKLEEYNERLASLYVFHWEMPEPSRSRFIERYLLKGIGQELDVALDAKSAESGKVLFTLTVRNVSDKPLDILEPQIDRLFLRSQDGQFFARREVGIDEYFLRAKWVRLDPGQTLTTTANAVIRSAEDLRADNSGLPPGVQAVLRMGAIEYLIDKPGPCQAVFVIEQVPMTSESRAKLKLERPWSGRAVSKPATFGLRVPPALNLPDAQTPKAVAPPATQPEAPPDSEFRKLIMNRPDPDLEKLAARASPAYKGEDASDSFYDILRIRETPNPKAVPVLEQIIVDDAGKGRIHAFAAAQALFAIGTPQAHAVLARRLLTLEMPSHRAIAYAESWEMAEPLRSRFIEQYLLKSLPGDLAVELKADAAADGQSVTFTMTLRNGGAAAFEIREPQIYFGQHVYLRTPPEHGEYLASLETVRYKVPMPHWLTLKSKESRDFTFTTKLGEGVNRDKQRQPVLKSQDYQWFLPQAGEFAAVAMFEQAPLNEES